MVVRGLSVCHNTGTPGAAGPIPIKKDAMTWLQLIIPLITLLLGGGVTYFVQSRITAHRIEIEKLRDDRRKVYLGYLKPIIKTWSAAVQGGNVQEVASLFTSAEFRERLFEINLMGSDEVVKAVNSMMQAIYLGEPDTKKIMMVFGELLLAIRRDLGYDNTQLDAFDMLASQITDIDQYRGEI